MPLYKSDGVTPIDTDDIADLIPPANVIAKSTLIIEPITMIPKWTPSEAWIEEPRAVSMYSDINESPASSPER